MAIVITNSKNESPKPQKYVSIKELNRSSTKPNIVPSKTLIINELSVEIVQDFDEDIDLKSIQSQECYLIIRQFQN